MSISPEEQDRLALPENREERMVRWKEYCQSLMDYQRDKGREAAYRRAVMSEAIKGTAYTPTLTPGLQASVDRDLLPAWRKAKDEAYLAGMAWGSSRVTDAIVEMPIAVNDPYLQYLYLLGVGQAIANAGRDIAQVGGKHDLDPQKKGGKQ